MNFQNVNFLCKLAFCAHENKIYLASSFFMLHYFLLYLHVWTSSDLYVLLFLCDWFDSQ